MLKANASFAIINNDGVFLKAIANIKHGQQINVNYNKGNNQNGSKMYIHLIIKVSNVAIVAKGASGRTVCVT